MSGGGGGGTLFAIRRRRGEEGGGVRGSSTSGRSFCTHEAACFLSAPPQALLLRHSKIAAVVRGEWSPQPRVTQLESHSIFNSNKQYISKGGLGEGNDVVK